MSDFDELLGKAPKGKKRGGGRAKATYLRYDPDTGEKARVTRDDDRYDEWLTPAQYKKEQKDEAKESEKDEGFVKQFAKDVGKDVLKDLKKPTRGSRRARKRIAQDVAAVTNKGGKSVLTKVLPLAMRLGVAAAAIGAAWWAVRTLEGRAVRKRVEAELAATEARLKRPLTERELAALLRQYESWFKAKMPTERAIASVKSFFKRSK